MKARPLIVFHRSPGIIGVVTGMFVLGCSAIAVIVVALQWQAAVRGYVTAESLWSKGQQEAVYHLNRFAERGNTADLIRARRSLSVPLSYREARQAMEAHPLDRDLAARRLREAGSDPRDIPGMIAFYTRFAGTAFLHETVAIWRRADQRILRLADIADELGSGIGATGLPDRRTAEILAELSRIDASVRLEERAISERLAGGARLLQAVLLAACVVVVLAISIGGAGIAVVTTRRIARSDHKSQATFEQAAVGMAQIDLDGRFRDVNEALCDILLYPRQALLGRPMEDIAHPDDLDGVAHCREQLIERHRHRVIVDKRYVRCDGQTVQCKLTASLVRDGVDRPSYILAVLEDVSEARRLAAELAHQAAHDGLTGLINRSRFNQVLEEALASARTRGEQHALGFIDLDQFKIVNDTCGHAAGDELLRQASGLLRSQIGEDDVLARLGGDEFALILHRRDMDAARTAAERLREVIADFLFAWEDRCFNITISMGLVAITEASPDSGSLLQAADTACYLAKDRGRNRIQRYTESSREIAHRRGEMEWVGRIRQALSTDRLRLDAQSIRPLNSGGPRRYELLARLVDVDGTVHFPGSFLGAAERYDIASAIDRWVLNAACRALTENRDVLEHIEAVHLNLSAQSLNGAEFLAFVERTLARYDLPTDRICFEITETAAISSMPEARAFMDRLCDLGCHFALDDFGSGLSSFGYLKELPIELIKIDGGFVRDIHDDPVALAVVRSIHDIARAVGKRTVAEFVETPEIETMLRDVGVDFAQGYRVGRPRPLAEVLESEHHALSGGIPYRAGTR